MQFTFDSMDSLIRLSYEHKIGYDAVYGAAYVHKHKYLRIAESDCQRCVVGCYRN